MNKNNQQEYFKKLFSTSHIPAVIITLSLTVEWQNQSFSNFLSESENKEFNTKDLLSLISFETKGLHNLTAPILLTHQTGLTLQIIPFTVNDDTKFLISITGKNNTGIENNGSLSFQKELQEILTLLVHEKSLLILSKEILIRGIKLTRSTVGTLLLFTDEQHTTFELITPDKKNILLSEDELKQEIKANLPYLEKWLTVNEKTLLLSNALEGSANSLLTALQCEGVAVSPCVFNGKLLSIFIFGKVNSKYTPLDTKYLDQLAMFQAFAVSSIKTHELNYTLETRLLQTQKLETIGKLASGMAHDFSNLLSSIFGSLDLLKRKLSDVEKIHHLLDNIENCAIRAKDLTTGLLSYGKPTPKRKELIELKKIINEIITVIKETFPKNITAEFKIADELYDVLGSSTEIYQILLNLCVNAKEAVGENGKIILTASNLTVNDVNIFQYPFLTNGSYINVSVEDNGTGIEEEHLLKIFDPYFTTKQKEGGSGLGLYVTYGIIKAHNGHINIKSNVGTGTTFEVFLPAFEESSKEKITSEEKIILIADDEIMLRDLLADLLESYGYHVIKVQNGAEALLVLTEEIKVDLLIVDFNMPVMNGIDCIKQVRKLGLKIPVILSTGSLPSNYLEEIEKENITGLVSKPYEFDVMLKTIKKFI